MFLHFKLWFEHGPNLAISLLYHHLADIRTKGLLSRKLYLQVDNSAKENKNWAMLAFLALLVIKGWFEEVYMYFLCPGHTHEDVDRMFSNFASLEKNHNCDTPLHFVQTWMPDAYKSLMPEIHYFEFVYDWKTWMKPYCSFMKGHAKPRAFLWRKNNNRVVEMWVKSSALAQEWKGRTENHGWEQLRIIPPGSPNMIEATPVPEEFYSDVRYTYPG